MQDTLIKSLQVVAMVGTVAFFSGCGTTTEHETMQSDAIAEVREIANEALRTANTAAFNAANAKDMAGAAQETADDALELAVSAQSSADANARRMNVMFHESMKAK